MSAVAIEKRTVIDRVEIQCGCGDIDVRLQKQLVEDGAVLIQEPHRGPYLACGCDIPAQFALVNAHLVELGYPPLEDWAEVSAYAQVAWTPERVAAAKERAAREAKRLEQARAAAQGAEP